MAKYATQKTTATGKALTVERNRRRQMKHREAPSLLETARAIGLPSFRVVA